MIAETNLYSMAQITGSLVKDRVAGTVLLRMIAHMTQSLMMIHSFVETGA